MALRAIAGSGGDSSVSPLQAISLTEGFATDSRTANVTALRAALESTTVRAHQFDKARQEIWINAPLFDRDSITLEGNDCTLVYDSTIGGNAHTGAVTVSDSGGDILITFPSAHGLSTNSRVAVAAASSESAVETDSWGGTLPGGLVFNRFYYAIVVNSTAIKLSLTSSGAAIAYSSAGSGHITCYAPQKQALWCDPAYTLGSNTAPGYTDNTNRWDYHVDVTAIDNSQVLDFDTGTDVSVSVLTVATAAASDIRVNDIVRLTGYDPVPVGTLQSTGRSTISSIDSSGGATDSEITTSAAHGVSASGNPVFYYTANASDIPAATPTLSKFTVYFANVVSATKVKLYDTAANAVAGGATGLVNFSAGIASGTHYILRAGYLGGEGGMRVLEIIDNGDSTTSVFINRISENLTQGLKLSKWKENEYRIRSLKIRYLRYQSYGMAFSGNVGAPGSLAIQGMVCYAPHMLRLENCAISDAPGSGFCLIAPFDADVDVTAHDLMDQSSTTFPDGNYFKALSGSLVVDYDGAQPGGSGDNTFTFSVAHGLDAGTATTAEVMFSSTGTVPAPLVAGTVYYARDITSTSFKVSSTDGGSAINITGAGTGTITVKASLYPDEATGYGLDYKTAVKLTGKVRAWNTRHSVSSNPSWQFMGGTTCRGLHGRNQGYEIHVMGNGQGKSSDADTHATDVLAVVHCHATGDGGNGVNMRSDGEIYFYGIGCERTTQMTGDIDRPINVKLYGSAYKCGPIQNNGYAKLEVINFTKIGHRKGATDLQQVFTDGVGAHTILLGGKYEVEDLSGNAVQTQNGGRTDSDDNIRIRPRDGVTLTQSPNAFNYVKGGSTLNSGVLRGAIVEGAGWNRLVNASGSGSDPNISGWVFGESSVTSSAYNNAFRTLPFLGSGSDIPVFSHISPLVVGGSSRTFTLEDNKRVAVTTSNSAVTITLPNSSKPGYSSEVVQNGRGVVTITAASGATLNGTAAGSITTAGQYSRVFLVCRTNTDGASAVYEAVTVVSANPKSVYAAGTAYSLTSTSAAVDFGTTDPAIALDRSGTWEISAQLKIRYNGATFAAPQTVTAKLRRTNNTAADVTNAVITAETGVVTTVTQDFAFLTLPTVFYTTTNANDAISMYADIAATPSVGSMDVVAASITAKRIAG